MRPGGAGLSGLHQIARAHRSRGGGRAGSQGPRDVLRARPGPGCVQHRDDDPLARFQRHLAGGRVGSSVRQSGRHSGGRRLAFAQRDRAGAPAASDARGAHRHDHVVLVKLATTAVVSQLLGLSRDTVINALSQVFVDGQALRTYRHAPNAGSRKSWAAGDATSRGVRLALISATGEMGYPTALSAPLWGFTDVLFRGKPFSIQRAYGSYVMENVLFKISYPAEFHAQTAVEAAMTLFGKILAMGRSANDIA